MTAPSLRPSDRWPTELLARGLAGQAERDIHVVVGEVRVRSALGAGSRFELMLPVMAAAAGALSPPREREPLGNRTPW